MPAESESPEPFAWTQFEKLDAFGNDSQDPEQIEIPDITYRQIRELNEALISKANEIAAREIALEQRIQEYRDEKQQFDTIRMDQSRSQNEQRLDMILRSERGMPLSLNQLSTELKGSNLEPTGFQELDGNHESGEATTQNHFAIGEKRSGETGTRSTGNADVNRLHQSAVGLREKSEFIAAVFDELNLVVRDLNRQQELLEQSQINQTSQPEDEFQMINDAVKRRFGRISEKIGLK
jgi:hypothetical protein